MKRVSGPFFFFLFTIMLFSNSCCIFMFFSVYFFQMLKNFNIGELFSFAFSYDKSNTIAECRSMCLAAGWRSEDNFVESFLSFHLYTVPGIEHMFPIIGAKYFSLGKHCSCKILTIKSQVTL